MATLQIGDVTAVPGELRRGGLRVGELRDGAPLIVPLLIMSGTEPGPVLWLGACLHGIEIGGVEVLRRIMREEVRPGALRGTIVAALAQNPWAFQAGMSSTPLYEGTGQSDAQVYPGRPNGTLVERMADRVFQEGMLKADVVIDVHSNYYPAVEFSPVTVCEDRKVLDASVDLAEKCGLPLSEIRLPAGQGWVSLAAQRAGKPSFLLEVLAQGYLDERSIGIGVHALLNGLRALHMIDGEPTPIQGLKVPPGRFGREFVICNRGGLAHFQKTAGDWLNAGDIVAVIRNIYGDVVEEVRIPVPGYIRTCLFGTHNEAVFEGSVLCTVLAADPKRRYLRD